MVNHSPWEKSHIFYGNDVPMSYVRFGLLKHRIGPEPPEIPLYVCSVTPSLVTIGKSKMVNFYLRMTVVNFSTSACLELTPQYMSFQVFSKEYSERYLEQYLEHDIFVPAHAEDPYASPTHDVDDRSVWTKDHRVKLRMGSDGRAMITTNWYDLVKGAHMSVGEMAVFEFEQDEDDVLFIMLASNVPMGGPVKA